MTIIPQIILILSTGLLFGYDIGLMSGAVNFIPYIKSDKQKENIISFVILGGIFSSIFAGKILQMFKKDFIIKFCHLLCCFNVIMFSLSYRSYFLGLLARFFIGFSISLNLVASTTFVADTVPADRRGFYVSLNEAGVTFGILLSYLANYFFEAKWRVITGLMGIFNFSGLLGLYLTKSDRNTSTSTNVGTRNQNEKQKIPSYQTFPFKKFLIGIYLVLATQFSGQPNFMFYAKNMVPNHNDSTVLLFGIVKFLSTFICSLTVDKFGRRILLNLGCTIMFLALLVIAQFTANDVFSNKTHDTTLNAFYLKLAFSGYALGFSISFGPLLWIFLSELYPKEWTSTLFGYTVTVSYIINFILTNTFLQLEARYGLERLLLFHAVCCFLAVIINLAIIPETRESHLVGMKNLRNFRDKKKKDSSSLELDLVDNSNSSSKLLQQENSSSQSRLLDHVDD